jgi:hypothetical protein
MTDKTGSEETPSLTVPNLWEIPRDERVAFLLLRSLVQVVEIESHLSDSDFKRLPNLGTFIKASHKLIADLGYGED